MTEETTKEKELLLSATECFNHNDYTSAKNYMIELVRLVPKGEYLSGLGVLNKKLGNIEEAEENFLDAINIQPSLYESYYNLGILYHEKQLFEKAIDCFNASLKVNPDLCLAHYNLGNTYRTLEQFEKAVKHYRLALSIKGDFAEAHYNLGVISEKLHDLDSALKYYENTIIHNPDHVQAHWNRALLLLLTGDFENGWKEYEWRLKNNQIVNRNFSRPVLKTKFIKDKSVYVYSEQGLGDAIQFVRYLPMLKEAGANVIFECDPKLYNLFSRVDGIDLLVERGIQTELTAQYDYQISLLSLPHYFNTNLKSIPLEIPYIKTDKQLVEESKSIIKKDNSSNVGIVWAGNPHHVNDKNRSCSLKEFESLFKIEGVNYFSLQVGDFAKQIKEFNFPLFDLEKAGLGSFEKATAAIDNLDLVISVDTSIAHLAGAMGKPAWLLLPYFPDWRWMLNRNDSPWYTSMKLFRQTEPGNWNSVFKKVFNELTNKVKQSINEVYV